MAAPIFRESALERLNSPEQLDEAIRITSPTSWLAALGLLAVVGSAVAWSIFGTVPTRVNGDGIIVYRDAEAHKAVAEAPGLLKELLIKPADQVSEGQVVAIILKPELDVQISSARAELAELEVERTTLANQRDTQLDDLRRYLAKRTQELQKRIAQSRERADFLTITLDEQKKLLERGFTTRHTVDGAQSKLFQATQDINTATSELTQLTLTEQEKKDSWSERISQVDRRLLLQRHTLDELVEKLEVGSKIISPSAGVVEQITAASGSYLAAGQAVAIITSTSKELEAKIFVAAADAKLIKPGLAVQVSRDRKEGGTRHHRRRRAPHFGLSSIDRSRHGGAPEREPGRHVHQARLAIHGGCLPAGS